MPGSSLEVADIFRAHGAAWRAANTGHISRDQFKVMSAIERCRTAALGGHVARCVDCAHEHIAYNSCRNRHCPKCQAGAAKAWLAAREAELLPVRYFHLVFTLPKQIADIAYQNKRETYNLLMRASADTVIKIAADPKHLGARVGITSVLHTWGSAMTHHPHVHMIVPGGGLSADGSEWIACRKNFFLSVRVLSRLYRRLILEGLAKLHNTGKLQFFGDHTGLIDNTVFVSIPEQNWPGSRCKIGQFGRGLAAPWRAGLPVALHAQDRHIQQPIDSRRRPGRHIPRQGLPCKRSWSAQNHDAGHCRVYPQVPDPRAAKGPAPHPSLWFLRQWQPCGQYSQNQAAARGQDHANNDSLGDTDEPPRVLAIPCPCCGGQLIIIDAIAPAQHPRAPPTTAKAAA